MWCFLPWSYKSYWQLCYFSWPFNLVLRPARFSSVNPSLLNKRKMRNFLSIQVQWKVSPAISGNPPSTIMTIIMMNTYLKILIKKIKWKRRLRKNMMKIMRLEFSLIDLYNRGYRIKTLLRHLRLRFNLTIKALTKNHTLPDQNK